ncbi:hypothetical protein [Hymenobacter sp. APR13]|uniref:hypothetical protein n=1 Tax=Hymenobacter sp. APR13 TaxID=1356852 RepID=UPI0005C4B65F|nr:hypothetical protein [Hymenobacter sp. APR13]
MYYAAGYYLVIPKHEWGTVNGHRFRARTWSVSTYISHVYPGTWGFDWEYSRRQLPENFTPTDQELTALHAWIGEAFAQGQYAWPGFFSTHEKAVEFKSRFLHALPQAKLLGIFLHESHCATAVAAVEPHTGPDWPNLATLLQLRAPEPETGLTIGFDLLGLFDFGGYEPFSYHVVEQEYQKTFGVVLNEYGLFATASDCQRVAAYTDTIANEPAVWLPFKTKLFGPEF